MTEQGGEWRLDVSDDIEIPGWFYVPSGLEASEAAGWVEDCMGTLPAVIGDKDFDGNPINPEEVRAALRSVLDLRASAESVAMFQVWPVRGPAAVTCHVNIVASSALPNWSQLNDAYMHRIEAPHVGPGMHCATRRTITVAEEQVDLASVHKIFDNGDVTLILSIQESIAALVSCALPGLLSLQEVIRMERADGRPFESVPLMGVLEDGAWPFEEAP